MLINNQKKGDIIMERWERICYAILIIGGSWLCGAYSMMASTGAAEHSVKNYILAISWLSIAIMNFFIYNIKSDNDIFRK